MSEEKDLVVLDDIQETETSLEVTPEKSLEEKMIEEENIDELKSIINMFNLNIQKKNIIRAGKLSELQDKITEQMEERIVKKADEFSNQDLLAYFKTVQETLSKSDSSLSTVDVPSIQLTQNKININAVNAELSKDSRENIIDAINAILKRVEKDSKEIVYNDTILDDSEGDEYEFVLLD